MAGNGSYLDCDKKMGITEIPEIKEKEVKDGMRRYLAKLPDEFYDLDLVIQNGAIKHGKDTWLDPGNPSLEHIANCASMFRHLADHYAGFTTDKESGLHPLLHLACRALMQYTREVRDVQAE